MKHWLSSITLAMAVAGLLGSCNSADFGSSSPKKGSADDSNCDPKTDPQKCEGKGPPGGPTPPGGDTPPKDCVDGDKVNFEWTGEVKACIVDQGKTYNFDSKACTQMPQAQFDCNWQNVQDELNKRGLLTETLKQGASDGAKLVSCGQSGDGNRIVVQWIKAPTGGQVDCKDANSGGHITTGCYTVYVDKDPPPTPTNEDERRKQVYACMNEL